MVKLFQETCHRGKIFAENRHRGIFYEKLVTDILGSGADIVENGTDSLENVTGN